MSVEEERWHVRIAPGEVKLLTLEQIDDLFRLDMIDGDTLLRQDGTEQWLPLRVVAGLDEQEAAPPPVVRSAPPPPPAPLPPPSAPAPFAPSPSFIPPAPVSARPPSFAPPPSPPRPSVPAASFAPPSPHPTAPLSFAPPLTRRASRAESLLIGLAALLGLLIALQRNGVLAALFAATGHAAAYERLEASLGGPGFGTPRAIDALTKTPRR